MGFSWRLLLLLGALTIPTCGYANPSFDYAISGPMVFRNGFNGGNCNGCEWIIAEGTIQPDTPDVFKKFLLRKKVSGGISVKFNSPGGSLLAGVRLGEMIRAAGLFSEVGKTIGEESSFDPETIEEKTRAEGICASACVYAFIGGKTRFAEKSKIGIHQFYDARALNDPITKTASSIDRSTDQLLTGILLEYVTRMGIDPKLVSLASSIPPWEDIKWLNDQELIDLRLENSITSYTPLSLEAFGPAGSYVETVSRSVYYSIRHRIYCKGNANSPYVAFLTSSTRAESKSLAESFGTTIKQSSLVVTGDDVERTYPLRLAALEISPDETQTVQAAVAIVGATMSELQRAKRVELRGESLSRNLMNIAFWLSFDLAGDRRKIGIASRSCVR
jgi:hypothetical protein